MYRKVFSLFLVFIFVFAQPVDVLAQQVQWYGESSPPVGGLGFYLDPGDPAQARYMMRGSSGAMWLTRDAIWLSRSETQPAKEKGFPSKSVKETQSRRGVNLKISFPGANPKVQLVTEQPMDGHVSIFKGKDAREWATGLALWGQVRYSGLYSGVDLVVRSTAGGFTWAYEVRPGANTSQLRMQVQGAVSLSVTEAGSLAQTVVGEIPLPPLTIDGATLSQLQAAPDITDTQTESMDITPVYDAPGLSVMDTPNRLDYSTFLGGSSRDTANGVALDSSGAAYIVGETTSVDFPVTAGAYDASLGYIDIFAVKLLPHGAGLSYATYIGGNNQDTAWSLAVENGVAYITGETWSADFPITMGTNLIDGDEDAFVVALNATGTSLTYSRMLSGTDYDCGYAIAVQSGYAYVTGYTYSKDFLGAGYSSSGDVFVVKLSSNGTVNYNYVSGGNQEDAGFGIVVVNGAAWVVGETWSPNFTSNFYGLDDAFVLSLSTTGTLVSKNSYGGADEDAGRGIARDTSGNIYITGTTSSTDFPFTEGTYIGSNDAFLLKVNSTNTQVLYGTALGGSGREEGKAITLDPVGGIIVAGSTASTDFPVTADAYQSTLGGSTDGFVTRFLLTGSDPGHRKYSSFLGGSGADQINAIVLDPSFYAYLVGQTRSPNFPTTADGLFQTLNNSQDAFFTVMAVGPVPKVSITKTTNNQDVSAAPGPYVLVSQPVTWRYVVRNTGELALTSVTVTDSKGVDIDCDGGTNTTTDHIIASLAPGAQKECLASGTSSAGQYTNLGSVSATTPYSTTISSTDPSYYFGASPNANLVKKTNGIDANTTPGVYVQSGSQVNWTYEVTNTGNVDLTNVRVVDNNGTPANAADDVTVCTIPLLAAGATDTTTCHLTGEARPGQYTNIAVVTGTPPGGLANVTDNDPSNYFGSAPALTLTKKINDTHVTAAPGPYLLVGAAITWKYEVINTGNVALTNVAVTDDKPANIDCDGGTNTAGDHIIASLAVGASATCTATGTAAAGQYRNIATVTGSFTPTGQTASATDDSFYFGAQPALGLEYAVNTDPADSSPGLYVLSGSTLNLTYLATNTGNVLLTNIVIKDDNGTPGSTGDDITVCTIPELAVGASYSCPRTAAAATGQKNHIAAATASPPSPLASVTASDPMYYFGATTSVTLLKKTNGLNTDTVSEVYALVGSTVNWTYAVTNTSNVALSQVTVADNRGVDIDCDGGANTANDHIIASLAAGASVTCTASGTAVAGQYVNTGSVTANPPAPLPSINASDTSHYFGTTLGVALVKQTNGEDAELAPGPLVAVGSTVTWSYTVTNNSNVTVSISVVDDNGTPTNSADDVTVCATTLAAGAKTTCSRNGTALAGQYTNIARVTATPPGELSPVTAQDTSHYFGVAANIDLKKYTNTLDANTAPGPYIHVGDPVNWTYTVTNTGNIQLTQVTVTDDRGVNIDCDGATNTASDHIIAILAPGASVTCAAAGVSAAGQYENTGSVTGNPPVGFSQVSDSDLSHYFGSTAGVNLEKWTNGVNATGAPGPYVLVGQPVTWTYKILNTGNIALANITVTDNKGVDIDCDGGTNTASDHIIASLVVGGQTECTASGTANAGQYTNTGSVQAQPVGEDGFVYGSDTSYYFGANPSIQIVKRTNGEDANTAPGPYIPVGATAGFTYEVSNVGNIALQGVEIRDDTGLIPEDCEAITTLAVGEKQECVSSATVFEGQQATSASAQAKGVHPKDGSEYGEASDSDPSLYFGYFLAIEVAKYTNGVRATEQSKPTVLAGTTVTWTYRVTNKSNVKFDRVEVTDDMGVAVSCPKATLAVAEGMTCTATGPGIDHDYRNTGTAVGTFFADSVQDDDVSFYHGVPSMQINLPVVMR